MSFPSPYRDSVVCAIGTALVANDGAPPRGEATCGARSSRAEARERAGECGSGEPRRGERAKTPDPPAARRRSPEGSGICRRVPCAHRPIGAGCRKHVSTRILATSTRDGDRYRAFPEPQGARGGGAARPGPAQGSGIPDQEPSPDIDLAVRLKGAFVAIVEQEPRLPRQAAVRPRRTPRSNRWRCRRLDRRTVSRVRASDRRTAPFGRQFLGSDLRTETLDRACSRPGPTSVVASVRVADRRRSRSNTQREKPQPCGSSFCYGWRCN